VVLPLLFYVVQRGALDSSLARFGVTNPAAFVIPVATLLAVSSAGAGLALSIDLEGGFFDKLLLTRVSRTALLIGLAAGDALRTVAQIVVVLAFGFATGLDAGGGVVGLTIFGALALAWSIVYSAIGYTIALRTANPQAIQGTNNLFLPLVLLSTSFAPQAALSGWFDTVAALNPVTYILAAMREALAANPDWSTVGKGVIAITAVGALTIPLVWRALLRRTT
jgi:ABC-2 type transport system permease protein